VKVDTALGRPPLEGILSYLEAEHSFVFDVASSRDLEERSGFSGFTSLSVGTLQIEIGVESGVALFVWGLHPRAAWRSRSVGQPCPTMACVRFEMSEPMRRGVSIRLAEVGEWETAFDEATGWLCIAKNPDAGTRQELLIASGVALGVTDGSLDSIWLHPVFT